MKVRELFSDESKWKQGVGSTNSAGEKVPYDDPTAVCWCLLGAIYHCYSVTKGRLVEERLMTRLFGNGKRKLGDCLSVWNDRHTFAEVKRLVVAEDV